MTPALSRGWGDSQQALAGLCPKRRGPLEGGQERGWWPRTRPGDREVAPTRTGAWAHGPSKAGCEAAQGSSKAGTGEAGQGPSNDAGVAASSPSKIGGGVLTGRPTGGRLRGEFKNLKTESGRWWISQGLWAACLSPTDTTVLLTSCLAAFFHSASKQYKPFK